MSEKRIFIIWNILVSIIVVLSFIFGKFQEYTISLFIVTVGANFSLLRKNRPDFLAIPLRKKLPIVVVNILVLVLFVAVYILKKEYLIVVSVIVLGTGILSLLLVYYYKNK